MTAGRTAWTGRLTALLCALTLSLATALPTPHVPRLIQVLSDHAEMVAEHGHSHGLEEDIAWASHGHSVAMRRWTTTMAVLPEHRFDVMALEVDVLWHAPDTEYQPPPVYRQLRPPRA